jgi:hypothetical protein
MRMTSSNTKPVIGRKKCQAIRGIVMPANLTQHTTKTYSVIVPFGALAV